MSGFPYTLSNDPRPRLGLIVLQADETIEDDFHRLFDPTKVSISVTRIPSGAEVTPDTLRAMELALPHAAGLFPEAARFNVIGYACTSGTTLIGSNRVEALVKGAVQTRAVTNPLAATFQAIEALGLKRVGIVSPYLPSIVSDLSAAFEAVGITVPDTVSFGEEVEANVARIAPTSTIEAARDLAERTSLDGLFLSCTNLRTHDILAPLEAELGLPVLSSNQTLAWHMAHLAGMPSPEGLARLGQTVP
mgnify:CR=1 FL=1